MKVMVHGGDDFDTSSATGDVQLTKLLSLDDGGDDIIRSLTHFNFTPVQWLIPSRSGTAPPLVTPPKVAQPVKYGHALVERDSTGYICLACSSCAGDMETLASIRCEPSAVFQEKQQEQLKQRLKDEHAKLEKLRKLRLLELELNRLKQLKKLRVDHASRPKEVKEVKEVEEVPKIQPGHSSEFQVMIDPVNFRFSFEWAVA